MPDELWMEVHDIIQETGIKTISKKKKCKKAKWLSEETIPVAEKRREAKSKGEKERYKHLNAEFQRIDRDKKSLLQQSMQRSIMAVWGGLTNSCEKKRSKKQRRKGKDRKSVV